MKKVYVMFGEIPTEENDEKRVNAFEAVLEGNEVRIIMPTALYSTCSAMARSLDLQPYLIEGEVICKDKNGQPVLINPTIVEKLRFDKYTETYICDSIAAPIPVDNTPSNKYPKPTFWEYFWGSLYASV
jgi:hypothetical protein